MRPDGWLTHRPYEAAQLLPIGLDLLLQDVVLSNLLLQLRHAWPIVALRDLLLQKSPPRAAQPEGPGWSPLAPSPRALSTSP